MSIINPGNLPQLTDIVNRTFFMTHENYPYVMRNSPLVKVMPMAKNTGLVTRYAEIIDVNQFASIVDPGAQIPSAKFQYGYEKDLFQYKVASRLEITVEDREAAKDYAQTIGNMIKQFSEQPANRVELDLTHRLTFAFVTSYVSLEGKTIDTTCGDGLALASTAHTLTGSSTTYSTIITGNPEAAKGSIEGALKQFIENSYDNFGVRVVVPADVIFCAPDPNTENTIDELLHATADVQSANAGTFNVFGTGGQWRLRRFTVPRLNTTANGGTDTNKSKMWGLASSKNAGIYFSELQAPTVESPKSGSNGEDINTLNWIWTGYSIYGIAVPGARWVRISSGTGANLSS